MSLQNVKKLIELNTKWKKLMIEINRQLSQKSVTSYRNELANKSIRRARTRTLIQVGGLLNLVGLLSFCGIKEGQDLQLDFENRDKAAILLGILSENLERLPANPTQEKFERWKNKGISLMKMRTAKKFL